jgi:hypothetical protein
MKTTIKKFLLLSVLTAGLCSMASADVIVRGACSNCTRTINADGTSCYTVTCTGTQGECIHSSDSGTQYGPGCNCAIIATGGGGSGLTGLAPSSNAGNSSILSITTDNSSGQSITRVVLITPSTQTPLGGN